MASQSHICPVVLNIWNSKCVLIEVFAGLANILLHLLTQMITISLRFENVQHKKVGVLI